MGLETIAGNKKGMSDEEFVLELDRMILDGTADVDPSLGNHDSPDISPEQASAQYVRNNYFNSVGDYCPPLLPEGKYLG